MSAEQKDLLCQAHGNLGWVCLLIGKPEQSLENSMAAQECFSEHSWIKINAATAYLCTGDVQNAKKLYEETILGSETPDEVLSAIGSDLADLKQHGVSIPHADNLLIYLRNILSNQKLELYSK